MYCNSQHLRFLPEVGFGGGLAHQRTAFYRQSMRGSGLLTNATIRETFTNTITLRGSERPDRSPLEIKTSLDKVKVLKLGQQLPRVNGFEQVGIAQ
jgi:hypothetical protein